MSQLTGGLNNKYMISYNKSSGGKYCHQLRNIIKDSLLLFNVSQRAEFFFILMYIISWSQTVDVIYSHRHTEDLKT